MVTNVEFDVTTATAVPENGTISDRTVSRQGMTLP
jgi:hypothetical protein